MKRACVVLKDLNSLLKIFFVTFSLSPICSVSQIDKKDGHFLKLQNGGTVLAVGSQQEDITVDERNPAQERKK